MLNIFLQSALTLPIMCYLMCSMLELRWPLRKSVAVMFVFMGFITLCDVVLASGSLNYAQIVDFYLFTTTLPALICFFILSKNRGFYFFSPTSRPVSSPRFPTFWPRWEAGF